MLSSQALFDLLEEEEFQELVALASEICKTPISLITLLDPQKQRITSSVGTELREMERSHAFCGHAILSPEMFVVEDATQDPRFQDNPYVTGDAHIRFYAGVPLKQIDGSSFGTLCVIDQRPRKMKPSARRALAVLARQVQTRLEFRAKQKRLEAALADNEQLSATLRETNELFTTFMEHAPLASFIKDAEGRYLFINRLIAQRFGVTEEAWIGRSDAEIWEPELAQQIRKHDVAVLEGGVLSEFDEVTPDGKGGQLHWAAYKFPVHNRKGEKLLAGMAFDRTREYEAREALKLEIATKIELTKSLEASQAQFSAFMQHNPYMASLKTAEGIYLYYNPRFAEFFGLTDAQWIGQRDADVLPQGVRSFILGHDAAVLANGGMVELSSEMLDSHGRSYNLKALKFTYQDARGAAVIGSVYIDVTEDVRRERQLGELNQYLQTLARTDGLTGLPNRRVFEGEAQKAFDEASRSGDMLSVLVLDVDDFKRRNDQFGHAAGDEALRGVGRVMAEAAKDIGTAARIGGEEFTVLLPGMSAYEAGQVAEDILARIRLAVGGLTASIGVADLTSTTTTWQRMLAKADDAMYEAKRTGKNRVMLHADIVSRLLLETQEHLYQAKVESTESPTAA